MVEINLPIPKSTYIYNTDSNQGATINPLTDDILKMAQDVGMTDQMHLMNNESHQGDQQLRVEHGLEESPVQEGYEEPEHHQESKPKPRKKPRAEKRFDDMSKRIATLSEQNEQLMNRVHQEEQARIEKEQYAFAIERQLLESQHKSLNDDIEKISGIMAEAQSIGDTETQIQANKVLSRIIADEVRTTDALDQYDRRLEEYQTPQPESEDEYYEQAAYNKLLELSDIKELKSDAYNEWLQDNPHSNPYDPDNYDEDLAQEINGIKKDFNKWLKLQRNGAFIGTEEYYQNLNEIIHTKFNTGNVPQPQYYEEPYYEEPQQQYYEEPQQQYNRGYGEMDRITRVPIGEGNNQYPQQQQRHSVDPRQQGGGGGYAPVTPVSRQGYNNYNQQDTLPRLSTLEESFAANLPMFDQKGTRLSPAQCIEQYKIQKAKQMR